MVRMLYAKFVTNMPTIGQFYNRLGSRAGVDGQRTHAC